MKHFEAVVLQLETISTDTFLQVVKQAIRPNTQFFDSLSLQSSKIMDELFQRGKQYVMLKDDTIATSKRTLASASNLRHNSSSKGEKGCDG